MVPLVETKKTKLWGEMTTGIRVVECEVMVGQATGNAKQADLGPELWQSQPGDAELGTINLETIRARRNFRLHLIHYLPYRDEEIETQMF